jgi:hypothetical protein
MGPIPRTDGTVTFNVEFHTGFGEHIVLVGSAPELGQWNTNKGVVMHTSEVDFPFWTSPPISLSLPREGPVLYKYVVVKADGEKEWESGPDRKIERTSFSHLMEQDIYIEDVASLNASTMECGPSHIKLDSTTTFVSRVVAAILGVWMLAAMVHAIFLLVRNGYDHGHSHGHSNGQRVKAKWSMQAAREEIPIAALAGFIAGAAAVWFSRRADAKEYSRVRIGRISKTTGKEVRNRRPHRFIK